MQEPTIPPAILRPTVWVAAPVEAEPETVLVRWEVIEVRGNRHFVGFAQYEGRVSSAIVSWDAQRLRGVTRSGRVYQLSGEPGSDRDAQYVLAHWLRLQDFSWDDVRDITEEVSNGAEEAQAR